MVARPLRRWLIACGALLSLLWLVYYVVVATLADDALRRSAARAGLRLTVGSVHSLYPGELRVRELDLEVPVLGVVVSARQLDMDPGWRSLFSVGPRIDAARASHVMLRWEGGAIGPIEARVREAAASSRASGQTDTANRGLLEMHGTGVRWQTETLSAAVTLRSSIEIRYYGNEPGRPARVVLEDGTMDISDVELMRAPRSMPVVAKREKRLGLHAILRLDTMTFDSERGLETAGRLYVNGADASVGLDLAGASESLRWMLAELEGQAFVLEAALRACQEGVALDGVHLESALTQASGALRASRQGWHGVLQVRRGSFSLGISVAPGGMEMLLEPPPRWLDVELARLRNVCIANSL